jgi:hypothetical protein
MYSRPINIGPGPSNPQTNFKDAYMFKWQKGTTFTIDVAFNTSWVSYVYLFDGGTHEVMYEFSNDNGVTFWNAGINKQDCDLEYGIVNYHKINVNPGNEHASDQFFQGELALNTSEQIGGSETVTLGFSDGHGRNDNAHVTLQIAGGP